MPIPDALQGRLADLIRPLRRQLTSLLRTKASQDNSLDFARLVTRIGQDATHSSALQELKPRLSDRVAGCDIGQDEGNVGHALDFRESQP